MAGRPCPRAEQALERAGSGSRDVPGDEERNLPRRIRSHKMLMGSLQSPGDTRESAPIQRTVRRGGCLANRCKSVSTAFI